MTTSARKALRPAIWIREMDWPERWVQADIIKRQTGRDGIATITARRGSMLMVRPMSDHGSTWWYFDEKRLDQLTGRTDYDAFGTPPNAIAEMGRKGGKASAAALTKEQRQERGRKAVSTRWTKYREMHPPRTKVTPNPARRV
jgi:hypothetical protein